MELVEEAISQALYAQAGALVRQELECVAVMEETNAGCRAEDATPNVAHVPWKLKIAYSQLSMMAHSSSTAMLDALQAVESESIWLASAVPIYNQQVARMLIGLHAALSIQLALQLHTLYLDMYGEGLSLQEQDGLEVSVSCLEEEGLFKKPPSQ